MQAARQLERHLRQKNKTGRQTLKGKKNNKTGRETLRAKEQDR